MSPDRMSATSVAHKSTGGTLQSLPEPVDPVGDAPDYLTFKTVAPLRRRVTTNRYPVVASFREANWTMGWHRHSPTMLLLSLGLGRTLVRPELPR
jgi:hypothetical protein